MFAKAILLIVRANIDMEDRPFYYEQEEIINQDIKRGIGSEEEDNDGRYD